MPPTEELELKRSIASIAVTMPCCSSCSRVITVTGRPVSPSMRLMLEPVISIFSTRCACCACTGSVRPMATPAPSAAITARCKVLDLRVMCAPLPGFVRVVGQKGIAPRQLTGVAGVCVYFNVSPPRHGVHENRGTVSMRPAAGSVPPLLEHVHTLPGASPAAGEDPGHQLRRWLSGSFHTITSVSALVLEGPEDDTARGAGAGQ